MTQISG